MTRVDSHHHLWDLDVRRLPWASSIPLLNRSYLFDELKPELALSNVDFTVVVQTLNDVDETFELLAIANREPLIGGVVGWVDVSSTNASDQVAELREGLGGENLVAIRQLVQSESDPRWLCRSDVQDGIRAVASAGLVAEVVIQSWQLPAFVEIVRDLGEVRFVLDHGGKPNIASGELVPWRDQVLQLGKMPNVFVKFSGLVTEADHMNWNVEQIRPYFETLVDSFGAGRIMWGSDWPVCLLAASYERVLLASEELTANFTDAEKVAVFGDTAVDCYALKSK